MNGLSALFESKKAVLAAVASAVNLALVKWGGLTIQEAATMTSPLLVAIGAQGFADFGKARAQAGPPKALGLFLAVGLGATLFLGSCASDGSAAGVVHSEVRSPSGALLADARWDGDLMLIFAGVDGAVEIYGKPSSGLLGWRQNFAGGTVYLRSSTQDFEVTMPLAGAVLPAWVREWNGWREGEAEALATHFGIVFEAATP